MGEVRKRGKVTPTSAMEMAEETASIALAKVRAFLKGESADYKGAMAAQKDIDRYIRLRNQQVSVDRSALVIARRVKQARKKARRLSNGRD